MTTGHAYAQTSASTSTTIQHPETQQLKLNGHDGTWFSTTAARRLLKDIKLCKAAEATHVLVQQRLDLEKARTQLLEANAKDSQQVIDIWKSTAEQQTKAALKSSASSWWRSPYLWLTVGFIAGTGATIGILHIAER